MKNETTPVDPAPEEPVKNETQPVTPTEPVNVLPGNATEQEITDFFNSADTDADGFLTKDEIKTAFTANG